MPRILGPVDGVLAGLLSERLQADGIDVQTGVTVEAISADGPRHSVRYTRDGESLEVNAQVVAIEVCRAQAVGSAQPVVTSIRHCQTELVGGHGQRADVFLVGRDAEVARVRDLVERAVAGVSSTVLVSGEAGIGKTSMVDHALASVQDGSTVVLRGVGLPLASLSSPFRMVRGMVRNLPEGVAALPVVRGEGTGPSSWTDVDPVEFDAWLDEVTVDRPVVLAVDDLHWVDRESLDVLRYVIAGGRERSVGVVMTLRSEEVGEGHRLHRWLADVRRLPRFEQVELGPVDRFDTGRQMAALMGAPPHESLVEEVFQRSGGNPYLTRLLVAGVDASATVLPEGAAVGLEDAVLAAWHELSSGARELTTVLAIAGRGLDRADLADLVGDRLDRTQVKGWLDEAVRHAVLVADGQGRYWFHHPLQAELLEARAYPQDRRDWHEACASQLRSRLGDGASGAVDAVRTVTIADHYAAAAMTEEALGWSLRVATELGGRASLQDVSRALRRAISLLGELDVSEPTRADLLWRLRQATSEAGDLDGELDAVEALIDATDADANPDVAAELLVRRTHLRHYLHLSDLSVDEAEHARDLARRRPESSQHALALAQVARVQAWESHDETAAAEAVRLADRAVAVASTAGDPRALAHAFAARSRAALRVGDIATARAFARRAYRAAVQSGDHIACDHAVATEYNALGGVEGSPVLRRLLSRRRDEMVSRGAPHAWVATMAQLIADSELEAGNVMAARKAIRFILGASPAPHVDLMTRLTAARLAVLTGETRQATEHFARVDEMALVVLSGRGVGWVEALRAQVLLANADARAAFDTCVRAMRADLVDAEKSERLLPLAAAALADAAIAAGEVHWPGGEFDVDVEVKALEHQFPPASSGDSAGSPIPLTGSLSDPAYRAQHEAFDEWYAAELARAQRSASALDRWDRAARALDGAGLPWEAAYAWMRLGEAHLLGDRPSRKSAAAALRGAAERATALEARPVLERVAALARSARIDIAVAPAVRDGSRVRTLTRREREILEHVVAGRTYGEIAQALVVSEKTVSSHVSNMLRKTGTSNRVELAVWAQGNGGGPDRDGRSG